MEGIGIAANIIAVVDLSAKVATLCLQYSKEVASARADIQRLHHQVEHLGNTMQAAKSLVERTELDLLPTSKNLTDSIDNCEADLTKLEKKLEPSTKHRIMRRVGFRALKWPFSSKEVDQTLSNLKRYEDNIKFGLQIDQTAMMVDIHKGVEQLALQATENATSSYKPRRLLPFPRDPEFVHRPSIEEWMQEQYSKPVQRMALVGMGGFGKSQLAIEFAHQVHVDHPDTSIFWVHGHTRETFEESYHALAELLALPCRHEPEIDILALVRDWLQRDDISPWFMILDNADDVTIYFPSKGDVSISQRPLASYLPKSTIGRVLVTSRSRDAAEKLAGASRFIRQIPVMGGTEALELFQTRIESTTDDSAAIELVHALDCIPLALNQAVAYINQRIPRVTAASYLQEFRKSEKRKDSLLRSDKGDLGRHDEVSNSVVVTWQVTFEQIRRERPRAANLLSLMSQFQAQNIPEEMLHDYEDDSACSIKKGADAVNAEIEGGGESNEDEMRQDFEDDMNVLRGYSLVSLLAEEGLCEMHPLVQVCTRSWISETGDAARWSRLFIKLAAKHFPNGSFETWKKCQRLLPHMESIMSGEARAEEIPDLADVLIRLGYYSLTTGDYPRAERLTAEAVQVQMEHFGPEHISTMFSMSQLSKTYLRLGRSDEAGMLLEEVSETAGTWKNLGDDPLLMLRVANNLVERFVEAEELLVELKERYKEVFGAADSRTLVVMADLATAHQLQGRSEESEKLHEEVLETQKASLGLVHPDTLDALSQIAWNKLRQGRFEEAEKLAVEALRMKTETLGDKHPSTIRNGALVANIYFHQHRLDEAEKLQAGVLHTSRAKLGTDHPMALEYQQGLASILYVRGRTQEAIALMQGCVRLQQQKQGDGHPRTKEYTATLKKWKHQVDGRATAVEDESGIRGGNRVTACLFQ
ncbi:kinesin light chain 3 [Plectosphaerella plurivora]|uniref:Kinesin light chain 3 n=1 Tax=Plectosphaerella plurivora TaxID=936078 RepID=A0A9P8V6P7_9PEZI|nr:kinesin light chain 3 [Plectosphaerella plurivora]